MSKLERRTSAGELTSLELPLVTVSFIRHIRVFDYLALASYTTLDGEIVEGRQPRGQYTELGGFVIEARPGADWDAVLDLLVELESSQPDYFHRLMRKCVELSNGPREADGFHDLLDDRDQAVFDVAAEREAQREEQGYVSAGDARAFLESARRLQLGEAAPQQPGLVRSSAESRFQWVRAFLEHHPDSESELAFLANTLISGCTIQGRPFALHESRDAALAICNLGLEQWPSSRDDRTLTAAFQIGLAFLHHNVCMHSARRLLEVAGEVRCSDRQIQFDLAVLRRELKKALSVGQPWLAREALEVVMILDTPAWGMLAGLTDQCPVLDGQPISSSSQLAAVRRFLDALPQALIS